MVGGTCLKTTHALNNATMCHVRGAWQGEVMTTRTVTCDVMVGNLALLITFMQGGKRTVGEEDSAWRCGELWRSHGALLHVLCGRS